MYTSGALSLSNLLSCELNLASFRTFEALVCLIYLFNKIIPLAFQLCIYLTFFIGFISQKSYKISFDSMVMSGEKLFFTLDSIITSYVDFKQFSLYENTPLRET